MTIDVEGYGPVAVQSGHDGQDGSPLVIVGMTSLSRRAGDDQPWQIVLTVDEALALATELTATARTAMARAAAL